MDIPNLLLQTLLIGLALLAWQRTERRRRWLVGAFFTLPAAYLLWRVAIFNAHLSEYFVAGGAALALNVAFWLAYGRRHPPGHQGTIKVIGQEDS